MHKPRPVKHYVQQALDLVEAGKAFEKDGHEDRAREELNKAQYLLNIYIPSLPEFAQFAAHRSNPFVESYNELKLIVNDSLTQKSDKPEIKAASQSHQASDSLSRRFEELRAPRAKTHVMPSPQAPASPMNLRTSSKIVPLHQEDPKDGIVSVDLLASWLQHIPDDLLLLDVRNRREYDKSHILAQWICCLEPISLRPTMSDTEIEDSLVIASEEEVQAFSTRGAVDHVVIYTQYSKPGDDRYPPLAYVAQALRRADIHFYILSGGFDAWSKAGHSVVSSRTSNATLPHDRESDSPFALQNMPSGDWSVSNGQIMSKPRYAPPPPPNVPTPTFSSSSGATLTNSGSQMPAYSPPKPPVPQKDSGFSYHLPQPRNGHASSPSPTAKPPMPHKTKSWQLNVKYHPALANLTGLVNMGNTCYMNCVIQCLEGTPQLAVPFLDGSYQKHVNVRSRMGYQGRLANEFAALTNAMARASAGMSLAPRGMKNLAGQLNDTFAGMDQQDCQEFLVFTLDGLHEDLNVNGHCERMRELNEHEEKVRERYNVRLASTIEWERYLKSDTSLVVDTFQGQYLSKLKCMVCGTTSSTYSAFSTLSLPLAPGHTTDIYQCFSQFVAPEILEGDDAWNCSHCKRKQRTIKTMSISRLPPVLIVHLKRFKRTMYSVDKLETHVMYPLYNLDLTQYWPNPQVTNEEQRARLEVLPTRGQESPFRYNLYAVTAHDGTLKGGHYTAFVKKPSHGWCHYDDVHVSRVPEQAALTRQAYLLFYQRV